jgi:predicted hydrocarbon binding protein
MESLIERELEGSVRPNPGGPRGFMLSSKSWAEVENELFRNFSTGASMFIFHLGRYYGRSMGSEAKSGSSETKKAFERLELMVEASGWGKLHVRWRKGDEDIGFELEGCAFCGEDSKVSSCHFVQGVVAGVAAEVMGREYKITETQCSRMGVESCKFIATPTGSRPMQGLISVLTR